ncbi:MAG: PQQ-binding-like beta-propeller repeat protein [Bacteroidales bacterium]|nr:PQQ-binding-like beta-propeller repeat protein [Bacteroidales bacterium]
MKAFTELINYPGKRYLQPGLLFVFILIFSGVSVLAQEANHWPSFHGPDRSNKSAETGLLKEWPEAGPGLLWTVSGLGEGYSSVSIAEGYLFTAGMIEQQTYVFAFDLEGNQVWKKPNGQAWEAIRDHARADGGSRSTPTFDEGIVYHLGELGRLAAFEYKTGKEVWSLELREQFDAEIPEYGYAESVFIDGDKLYCSPAGKSGYMVCLNKKDGKLIWVNNEIPGSVGFSSLVMFEYGDYQQLTGLSSNCIYGVDSKTGKMLWNVEYENSRSNNVMDPIFHDGYIFASSGYGKGSILLNLNASGGEIKPETIWHTDLMDNHHGGVILHKGYLYGAGHNSRGWFCLDFMTGKQMWKSGGKGSLTFADDMLYCLDERGIMTLVKATPEAYVESGRYEVPEGGKAMHWAHPVVSGGRLYVRHDDKLFTYDADSLP